MHFINFVTEFINRKLGTGKKTMFIQFITFGLFTVVTVVTYVPKGTDLMTIISAIVIFWIILFVTYRLFQYFKIL